MIRFAKSFVLVISLLCVNMSFSLLVAQSDESINVMTFNIRFPNPGDGFNYWPNRKELVASMIRYHEADLIGVQEAFLNAS